MKRISKGLMLLAMAALAGITAGCGNDIMKTVFGGNHVHSFRPVYRTIYHEAVTHTEDRGHYEIVMVRGSVYQETSRDVYSIICSCGWYGEADSLAQIDDVWEKHAEASGEDTCYGYKSRLQLQRELVKLSDPVYEDVWVPEPVRVVDREAWEERVLDHEECACGAVRQ